MSPEDVLDHLQKILNLCEPSLQQILVTSKAQLEIDLSTPSLAPSDPMPIFCLWSAQPSAATEMISFSVTPKATVGTKLFDVHGKVGLRKQSLVTGLLSIHKNLNVLRKVSQKTRRLESP